MEDPRNLINPIAERKLLNAGLCALMSVDGNDLTPAQAARTSYRDFVDAHTTEQNENLVDYLIRKRHDTPVEFAGATFYMVMPIFVARQMVRHRTASINEESLRYVAPRAEFYIPATEECKGQSKVNKQGSSNDLIDMPGEAQSIIQNHGEWSHRTYHSLVELGLSKELSRTVLPLGQYTAWYWKANLRNIFHLLQLRVDAHAQYQIRVYADTMLEMLQPMFPNTVAAWENHVLNALTLSGDEVALLRDFLCGVTKDEFTGNLEAMAVGALRKTRAAEFLVKVAQLLPKEAVIG